MKLIKKTAVLTLIIALCLVCAKVPNRAGAKTTDAELGKIVFDGDSTYEWSHFYSIPSKDASIPDLNITVLDKSGKTVPSTAYTLKICCTWWDEAEGKDVRQEVAAPYGISANPDSDGFCEFIATATAVSESGYAGEIEATFHIMDKHCLAWICATTDFEGSRKEGWRMCDRFFISADNIKAPVVIGNDGSILVEGRDYKLTYYTRADLDLDSFDTDRFEVLKGVKKLKGLPTAAGGYVMKMQGIGSYYGETEMLLDIISDTSETVPAEVSTEKITAGKKAFTIQWKKESDGNAAGYQIEYSTKKNFKTSKTVNVEDADATSIKVGKLKGKKTYYARIRSYITAGSEIIYSDWSEILKVKTKK